MNIFFFLSINQMYILICELTDHLLNEMSESNQKKIQKGGGYIFKMFWRQLHMQNIWI